ncbi:related to metal homeostasis protein [Cephalotrichum gorgonifer]|uniref:Related to metal homeostasis protein n=1 Tax=Cephalotrichum gorgonifer TaxID=2041049 RepID=A0AAE8N328_9PEZI|nr:related to metal homeostasis protein [Cephalotrichum gorgonifer]
MAGGYERITDNDADDLLRSPTAAPPLREMNPIPNSPPPSFHSRNTSPERRARVDQDLEDAFGDDDDSEDESDDRQRLVRGNHSTPTAEPTSSGRESPSAPAPTTTRNGYQSVPQPSGAAAGRVYGGGSQADGVFSNMAAKPERGDGEKEEMPPSYEQAAADQAPPYWETTILAPGMGGPDDVFIDGLPVGSFFSFVWNAIISWSFQIPGFLLTYLLHSTHAAKNGSRLGLGITLIQFGLGLKLGSGSGPSAMPGPDGYASPPDPNSHDFDPSEVTDGEGQDYISGTEWLMYIIMVAGWYILIRALGDYAEARRHERLVLQSPTRGLGIAVVAEGESPERAV